MSTWYTADTPEAQLRIKGAWVDAPVQNTELLGMLLSVAKYQVLTFAPETEPTPPGGIVEVVEFVAPADAAAKGTTASGVLTRYVGDVATIEIAATNPTAAGVSLPTYTVSEDPAYEMDNTVEYAGESGQFWLVSWSPGIGLQVQVSGIIPAGGTWTVRTAFALIAETVPETVPDNHVLAQLMQVRNLWNAGRTTGDGDVGPEGFTFRPYPLDNTIKAVIRPIDWKPHAL